MENIYHLIHSTFLCLSQDLHNSVLDIHIFYEKVMFFSVVKMLYM